MLNCCAYCSSCPVLLCDDRSKKANIYIPTCNGECKKCDGAINDQSIIDSNLFEKMFTNGICNIYHLQKDHEVVFSKLVGNIDGDSNIEKLIAKIKKCKSCKYGRVCQIISKNISIKIEEYLDIEWNFNNKGIINAIPEDKFYAFFICESLQYEIENIFN